MSELILVTGISGFVAGRLARALAAEGGAEVVGVGRSAPSAEVNAAGVRFVPLDLRDCDATLAALRELQPATVYHLAAISVLAGAGARDMLETNVAGTWNVLEAGRQAGVGAVVVASSDKQYGALAAPPYDDEDSTAFLNGGLYELSKAQQDQVARVYAGLYDTPAVRVARLVNLYGPGDLAWTRIVPGTIRRTVLGEAPRLTAGKAGEALREYVYVDDAVTALRALAADAHARGNAPLRRDDGKLARVAYNVGPGARLAAAGVIEAVQRVLREDFGIEGPPPVVQPGPAGVFEPGSQFNRTEKLAALLPGFAPRPFDAGLRLTVPWYVERLRQESLQI
jgi:CDP-glucose 4,6-dehydratase